MIPPYTFNTCPSIRFGEHSINNIGAMVREIGHERALIVSDQGMVSSGIVEKISSLLNDDGIEVDLFTDVVADPPETVVHSAVRTARLARSNMIIGLGGGSSLDVAKLVALLVPEHQRLIEAYGIGNAIGPRLPLILVPTTAGTGSEVTHHAVIIDSKNNEKISCRGEGFVPTCAIVDYNLTLSKPRRLTIDSAIDTLTHGIEAYISKKATLFSDRMALDTIRLVTQNIYAVDKDPKDLKAREGLMLAATLGGLAFSNASICLVHGMSRPLGSNFKVPHGLSNAMLLPTITEFSIDYAKSRYADCSRAGNFAELNDDDNTACEKLVKGLYKMNKDFDVPSMEKFGIDERNFEEKLKNMATDAEVSGAPNLNPRVPTVNEMVDLYGKAWRAF